MAPLHLDEASRFDERLAAITADFEAGRTVDALRGLRAAVRLQFAHQQLYSLARAVPELGPDAAPWRRFVRIAMVSSTTQRHQLALLRMQLAADGIGAALFETPFDQIWQQIGDPGSELHRFAPQLVFVAPSLRDIEMSAGLDAELRRWSKLHETLQARTPAAVIQHGFVVPSDSVFGNLDLASDRSIGRFARRLNLELAALAGPSFALLDVDGIAASFGKHRWYDPRLWYLAKDEVSSAGRPVLARAQAAVLRGMLGLAKKAIVLDLDNTLWGGVVGEDGVANLVLGGTPVGEAFAAFQAHLLQLRQRGVLLAIASKNNLDDAMRALAEHPEMVLREDSFAALQIHWNPKSTSIAAIAQELDVGLDSLVFFDDSPIERAEVRAAYPDVEVVPVPADPAAFIRALQREGFFDIPALTDEDYARAADKSAERQRQISADRAHSLEEFLAGLEMRAVIEEFDVANLPRIVQLIHRTNQYNLTTRRYSEGDVRALMESPGVHTRSLRLRDRFGDRGLVALVIARELDDALDIDTWLMSCRVLNRTVEHRLLAVVANIATTRELTRITGTFVPTAKNAPAQDHYSKLAFELVSEVDGTSRWQRSLDALPVSFVEDETPSR